MWKKTVSCRFAIPVFVRSATKDLFVCVCVCVCVRARIYIIINVYCLPVGVYVFLQTF